MLRHIHYSILPSFIDALINSPHGQDFFSTIKSKCSIDKVNVYDFPEKGKGKAIPYGVYDIKENKAWVSVGIDNDTAEFAVETIRKWWIVMGSKCYPNAK